MSDSTKRTKAKVQIELAGMDDLPVNNIVRENNASLKKVIMTSGEHDETIVAMMDSDGDVKITLMNECDGEYGHIYLDKEEFKQFCFAGIVMADTYKEE